MSEKSTPKTKQLADLLNTITLTELKEACTDDLESVAFSGSIWAKAAALMLAARQEGQS